jgi:hypothetical protein
MYLGHKNLPEDVLVAPPAEVVAYDVPQSIQSLGRDTF